MGGIVEKQIHLKRGTEDGKKVGKMHDKRDKRGKERVS